jgi:hypothetical protein
MGVDGDSVHSAANYLTKSGVRAGAAGVRRALFAYNHVDWYVNDVLYYASQYGGGTVPVDTSSCGPGNGNPNLPSQTTGRVVKVLAWAKSHDGDTYRMGAAGPHTWDCSSFTQAAYAQVGIHAPHRHSATPLAGRRQWHPHPARPRKTRRPDLLGLLPRTHQDRARHDHLEPSHQTTIEARNSRAGVGHFSYANAPRHHIFEIWRVRKVAGPT